MHAQMVQRLLHDIAKYFFAIYVRYGYHVLFTFQHCSGILQDIASSVHFLTSALAFSAGLTI